MDTTGINVVLEGEHFIIGNYATLVPKDSFASCLTLFVKRDGEILQHKSSGYDNYKPEDYKRLIPALKKDLNTARDIMDRDGKDKAPIWVLNYWEQERPTDLLLLEFLNTL